jgi:predicted GIY-YIG superfamily endonuclease
MRTALYRHFDRHGTLLYVGIARDVARRSSKHDANADWADLIVRIDVEHHDTRELALAAEARAIKAEHPVYNIRGQERPRSWAVLDTLSGRADGWYARYHDIADMLDFYKAEIPLAKLVAVPRSGELAEVCRAAIVSGKALVDITGWAQKYAS